MTGSWIPGVVALAVVTWMALACTWSCRARDHVRAPLRARLRAQCREILGTRYQVPRDGEPLSEREQESFNGYVLAEHGPLATEPQRERGTQQ